jgi:hypothetical protein
MVAAIGSLAHFINVYDLMSNREPVSWYYETELLEMIHTKFRTFPPMEQLFNTRATRRSLRCYVVLDIKKVICGPVVFLPRNGK